MNAKAVDLRLSPSREYFDQGTENPIRCEFLKQLPIPPGVFANRLLFSYYYFIHVAFILRRLTVLFALEAEDGCRSSETCIKQTVCCYLKIISCLLCVIP